MTIKLLLAGDGGQGIQTIAYLLTEAAFAANLYVSDIPNFGLEQRGGVSLSFLRFSDEEIAYPKFRTPNIMLVLSSQARERSKYYTTVDEVIDIENFQDKLKEKNIPKQSINIFFLGLLGKKLEEKNILKIEKLRELLEKKLKEKDGWEENQKSFEEGINN